MNTNDDDQFPRYYVQGETVRGEPRVYWVVDRENRFHAASDRTRDQRQAERWCKKLLDARLSADQKELQR